MIFRTIIFFSLFISASIVVAQKTMSYTDEYRGYREGQELFDKLKYSAAQFKFKQTINNIINPQDELRVNAEFYFAVCALELFHQNAELLLSRFVLDHPDHPKSEKVFFQLGRHNYRLKKFKKAIEFFSKVDVFDLTNEEKAEYHFKIGYAYFNKKKLADAKPHFKEIILQESDYRIPAIYFFSHIAYTEENLQTALNGFNSISTSSMFKSIVPYYITQIYYKQKQYNALIEYAPIYLDSINDKRKGEFSKLIGNSYYYNEKYKEAIPYFLKFKKSVKATREDNYQIGYSFYRVGEFQKAVQVFMRVVTKKDGLSQTAYYHMADSYLKLNEKDYARNAFRAASKLDFENVIQQNSLFNYAKLAYELSYNPYDEAIDAFHEYIDTYPNSPEVNEAYEFLLKVYMTTKNYDDALTSLDNMKYKDDRMKMAYQTIVFNRAVELYHNELYNLARDHFGSVKKYPMDKRLNSLSLFWMGECCYNLRQYTDAFRYYNSFRIEPGAVLTEKYKEIDYNIGYSFFKMARPFKETTFNQISKNEREEILNKSIKSFRSYTQQSSITPSRNQDACLRIADSYFLLKNDERAIEYYDKALGQGNGDLSYALYQKATALGLIQDYEEKAKTLKVLTKQYPDSRYQQLSLLGLAQTYNDQGENILAIETYIEFVSNFPNNNFVSSALVEIGGIYLKEKKYDQAEKYFSQVMGQYPDAEVEYALSIELMKGVYEGRNDLSGYYKWLNSQGIEVSQNERDSIFWTPVQIARDNGDCKLQIEKSVEYLNNVIEPKYAISAHYYIGNCLYAKGQDVEALEHYNFVVSKPNNNYYSEVLKHAGIISYSFKDYHQALSHFSTLEKLALLDEDINLSLIGQMRCFWFLKNYQSTLEYCEKTLEISGVEENVIVEANLYKGVSLKEMQNFEEAIPSLRVAAELTKSIKGAEAKFHICEIFYLQGEHDSCENEIMELVQQKPSYDYWIARCIILLGDNFVAVGDYFNAKHSLQSIIDNYEGDNKAELVRIAQSKIDEILIMENADEDNFEKEDVEIDFNEVDPKDHDLFEDNNIPSSDETEEGSINQRNNEDDDE